MLGFQKLLLQHLNRIAISLESINKMLEEMKKADDTFYKIEPTSV